MTCMPETHPCPCTLISVLRSGWLDSCDMALHGISTLMPANFSRVPASVRAGGPASVSLIVLQKTAWNIPRNCSSKKKKNKTDAWAAQARKEVAPQPRGHLTTRRQLPIGRGMCPHQISCSNSSACTPFLLLTYRSTIAELRSRSWREGGNAR